MIDRDDIADAIADTTLHPRPFDMDALMQAERDEWRDLARRLAIALSDYESYMDSESEEEIDERGPIHRASRAAVSDADLARAAAPDDGGE